MIQKPPSHIHYAQPEHSENKKTGLYRVTTSLHRPLTRPVSVSTIILCRCNRRNLLCPDRCRLRHTAQKPSSTDSPLRSSQHTERSLERTPLSTLFVIALSQYATAIVNDMLYFTFGPAKASVYGSDRSRKQKSGKQKSVMSLL